MKHANITFELWCLDPLEMLVNNLTAEQLLEAFPIYAHTFGEAVTKAYMVRNNKRIALDKYDIQYLTICMGYKELYNRLQKEYRKYAKEGNVAEMKRLSKGICHVETYATEMSQLFITKDWR